MAVTFADIVNSIGFIRFSPAHDYARIGSQAHSAALVFDVSLVGHKVNNLVSAFIVELARGCVAKSANVPCVFYDHHLHTETNAKAGDVVLPCVATRFHHTLRRSDTEASRYDYPVDIAQ